MDTIWDGVVVIWEFVVSFWDILVFPGYTWNLLCIAGDSVVSLLAQFIPLDQIPWDQVGCVSKYIFITASLGTLFVPLIVTVVPRVLGFKEDGIRYESIGSRMMSYHNGYTPAGGFVASMQSLGTRGIFFGMNIFTMIVGCLLGAGWGVYLVLFGEGYCDVPPANK